MSYLGEDGWGRVAAGGTVRYGGGVAPALWADAAAVRAG
jgi:hypothetical protein